MMIENITNGECAPAESLRANVYCLLAVLMAGPPYEPVLERLRKVEDCTGPAGSMAVAWRRMKEAAVGTTSSELDMEYHALFVGLGKGELVPYGSWYQAGRLMAAPLAQLRSDLSELGIEKKPEVFEVEDHAAALCETMALVCARSEFITNEREKRFFDRHIASWMRSFFQDMQRAPSARFFRAVGVLGETFLRTEMQYLSL
jgi:TorA maturation chaperone TorD